MWREFDLQVQVTTQAIAKPGRALTGQTDLLAAANALGDGDLEGALVQRHVAIHSPFSELCSVIARVAP